MEPRVVGYPVIHNLQTVFDSSVEVVSRKPCLQPRHCARHSMINAKLEYSTAIGAHLIHLHHAGSDQRSGDKGNQDDTASQPSRSQRSTVR
jgi:hypothetical protein